MTGHSRSMCNALSSSTCVVVVAPGNDAGDVLGSLTLTELDGVGSQVDGMATQSVESLQEAQTLRKPCFILGTALRLGAHAQWIIRMSTQLRVSEKLLCSNSGSCGHGTALHCIASPRLALHWHCIALHCIVPHCASAPWVAYEWHR